jgi:hypothetical protein
MPNSITPETAAASLGALANIVDASLEHVPPATKAILTQGAQVHYGILQKYLAQPPVPAVVAGKTSIPFPIDGKPADAPPID